MSLPLAFLKHAGQWTEEPGTADSVVVTTRARLARNVQGFVFAPHATSTALAEVQEEIIGALEKSPFFTPWFRLDMTDVSGTERGYLRECRLISKEMERGGASRSVYVAENFKSSIMLNEEDHLRMQALEPGFQPGRVMTSVQTIEAEVSRVLGCATHPRYGFLTACPTNAGTGLRISAMLHLPGLVLKREVEETLAGLSQHGLTSRGFWGENTDNIGDFYQISNEVTLGKSAEVIVASVVAAVQGIAERERTARKLLLARGGVVVEDVIWRSYAVLAFARKIESAEAMRLLSRLRLGIEGALFPGLTHETLNRLITDIQPNHLLLRHAAPEDTDGRDVARAALIRKCLHGVTDQTSL